MQDRMASPWALILAGGDGTRLRPLTSQIVGDDRPKQFCALLDGETLLERTRRRTDRFVRFDRQVVVVSRAHEPYFQPLVSDLPPGRLVIQPENRGTVPGIVYPLLEIEALAGDVPVVVLPSDHYVSDDVAFAGYVQAAVDAVRARRDLVVLLGIEPSRPETDYGWIVPSELPLEIDGEPVFQVRRFWEKPGMPLAERLFERGCFWNSFVMVGWLSAFLDMVGLAVPAVLGAFVPLRRALGTSRETAVVERIYRRLPATTGFSETVLAGATHRLGVVRVKGVEWSDWGHPRRVLEWFGRTGARSAWIEGVQLAEAG